MTLLRPVAAGGLGAFVALVAVQHPLRPDLPATQHFISEYARGSTRGVQVAAFAAWSVSLAATAVLTRRAAVAAPDPVHAFGAVAGAQAAGGVAGEGDAGSGRWTTRSCTAPDDRAGARAGRLAPARPVAAALVPGGLALAAAGTALAACFATVTVAGRLAAGATYTTEGRLHDVGTLGILAGLLTAALAGLRALPTRRNRRTGAALAAGFVVLPSALVATGLDWPGVGQRIVILIGVAWQAAWIAQLPLGSAAPRG